jgi:hypothetical protein
MTHNATKTYYDKYITPVDDAYLFSLVHGQYKGIKEGDIVLLDRESRICRYKVHTIQYFTPHGDEFFGKLLWVGYEK